MILARVRDELVATVKTPSHSGRKLLLLEPLELDADGDRLAPAGSTGALLIALDAVDAGVGDRVLVVVEGFAAMTAVGRPLSPIDAAIVGVVERAELR